MRQRTSEWTAYGKDPDPWGSLTSGDVQAALAGFATQHLLQLRQERSMSDGPAIGFGVCLWLLGDTMGAGMVWSHICDEAIKGHYSYSSQGTYQGGLLLWFASVWLNDEEWHAKAEALLIKLLHRKQPVMGAAFPSALAKLLRCELDITEIEAQFSEEPLEAGHG